MLLFVAEKRRQANRLNDLLSENQNLNILYLMKEQLQEFWNNNDASEMKAELEQWCVMADQTNMTYFKTFARSIRKNKEGTCNYAKHQLTSADISQN